MSILSASLLLMCLLFPEFKNPSHHHYSCGVKEISSPSFKSGALHIKELLQLLHRIIWILDRVSSDSGIDVDLMVVSAHLCIVAEKMDGLVIYPADALFRLQVLEAVCFVPAGGEYIERYLTPYRVTAKMKKVSITRRRNKERMHGAVGYTDVRPKSGNCFLKASTIFSRIPCCRSIAWY